MEAFDHGPEKPNVLLLSFEIMFIFVNKSPFFSPVPKEGEGKTPVFFPRSGPSTSFQFSAGTLGVIPVIWFPCNWAGHENKLLHLAGFSRNVLLLSAMFRLGQKICAWFCGVPFSRYTTRCLIRSPCHSGPLTPRGCDVMWAHRPICPQQDPGFQSNSSWRHRQNELAQGL